jgi:hypothetical protein
MKRSLALAAVLALSNGPGLQAQPAKEIPMVSPNQFAILPWGWTPGDPEALEGIRECGFNLAGFVRAKDLDAVREAGLKAFLFTDEAHVSDAAAALETDEIQARVTRAVEGVLEHEAVYGHYLRDEPSAHAFPGLGRWVKAYAEAAPRHTAYVNLLPTYASEGQLGTPGYEEYVERFVAEVQPPYISYDHYALMDDGSLRDGYYLNLEIVRRVALRHGLPFWNIVLSNAHFYYDEPSPGGLRFQAYTTLAYGARGISYFTYFTPATGNYRLGPVDQFGNRTATWAMLRDVNLQIHCLAPVYTTLRSVNVFHHPNVPDGCSGIETSRFVKDLQGNDLLVGEFEDPHGSPYVMVVNKDRHRSTTFDVGLNREGRLHRVSPYSVGTSPWARGEDCWLAPGQGALLGIPGEG